VSPILSTTVRTRPSPQHQFHELSFYTLAHPDTVYFIHQHAVDAFAAQAADENTKPIKLTFALIGLYLFLKKGYIGKQVQNAHVKLSQNKKVWPSLELPEKRGAVTVSVWDAYENWHHAIAHIAQIELGV
jgi:hypothetical protein